MPTFATLQAEADERGLVRKIQKAIAFIAPMTVALPAAITGSDSLPIDLKALGYLPIGLVTPDGYTFSREIESEDIDALGYASAIRSDTTRVPRTVSFTALEKGRKHMLELTKGTSLSGVTQAASGEIVIDEPDLPLDSEWRLLIVGSDGPAANNWILGKGYGASKLSATGEETWGREGAISQQLTFNIFTDDEVGVPVREYYAGTGAKASADILGFTQAPPALPTITSVLPSGAATGAQVTIKGTGFTGATAVAFGAVNAPVFTVVDSTTIVVTVPSSTAGTVLVTVTNATGASTGFSYTRGA